MPMMQELIAYIIIAMAILIAIVLLWRRFSRHNDCRHHNGCTDCPLSASCTDNANLPKSKL